jgi:hypothetical protein
MITKKTTKKKKATVKKPEDFLVASDNPVYLDEDLSIWRMGGSVRREFTKKMIDDVKESFKEGGTKYHASKILGIHPQTFNKIKRGENPYGDENFNHLRSIFEQGRIDAALWHVDFVRQQMIMSEGKPVDIKAINWLTRFQNEVEEFGPEEKRLDVNLKSTSLEGLQEKIAESLIAAYGSTDES